MPGASVEAQKDPQGCVGRLLVEQPSLEKCLEKAPSGLNETEDSIGSDCAL
jgi:hypothetical protein